jgi:PAS domain S-box-containing protein
MDHVKILIVDDKEQNIIALEALLKRDDIEIFSTTSPNEALRIAWENDLSIALVDVQMPGMDGFELVEILKSNPKTKDILVIFVTAISKDTKYTVKGLGTGAIDYLYKPLDPYITMAKVDSFVQLARHHISIKRKNEELQNFALVVKNSADIICSIDAQSFRVMSINPAVEKILGFSQAEAAGKNILDFAVEDQRSSFRTKMSKIITDNLSSSVFEVQFYTFNKRIIWAECRAAYQNKTIFLNISDVSPQKSYLNQLIKSKEEAEQSKKIKEIFLANMSHELRTPVNGIIGLTDHLRKTPLNDQQSGIIDLLVMSSQSLLGVINDVLDISKMEAGKFNIVRSSNNLQELLASVYGLLKYKADEKDLEFLLEIDKDVPIYVMVDPLRLNQILMNLLSNAIKFTERGFVKLKVSVVEQFNQEVKLNFSVEDSGIGIEANKLSKIFDPFEQAEENTSVNYGGTGLGLSIVKKLAELKGGEITIRSKVGKGSIFSFTNWYSISGKPKEKTDEESGVKIDRFENISVLVAEDNLINQFILSKMLKDWNIDVEMVDTGFKVLDKMKANNYSLILMDTHMPGMNGYETAKAIRMDFEEPKRSIPIISLSASSFEYEHQEAVLSGMNDVLSKPFNPDDLFRKIYNLLNIPINQ